MSIKLIIAANGQPIRVATCHEYPPIPIRDMDWSAVDDQTYDGSPSDPVGTGATEQEAIDDLMEKINERNE